MKAISHVILDDHQLNSKSQGLLSYAYSKLICQRTQELYAYEKKTTTLTMMNDNIYYPVKNLPVYYCIQAIKTLVFVLGSFWIWIVSRLTTG